MTGFFRGFFRPKPTDQPLDEQLKAVPQQEKTFFLSPDDAKTYGDINYMRTAKTVRRTFPKTASGAGAERIEQVSAMESIRVSGLSAGASNGSVPDYMTKTPAQNNGSQPDYMTRVPQEQPQFSRPETDSRRRTDTSIDMFRSMARDLKRK